MATCPADRIKKGHYFKNEDGWAFECISRTDDKLQGNRVFDDHANIYAIGSKRYRQLVRITKREYEEIDKGILDAYMCT